MSGVYTLCILATTAQSAFRVHLCVFENVNNLSLLTDNQKFFKGRPTAQSQPICIDIDIHRHA